MTKQKSSYMLLNRLQSDCYAYLSYGCKLWGINPKDHMKKMFELWNTLKIKPQWLSYSELKMLNLKLTRKEINNEDI